MAVAIPILMSATGATAAVAGALGVSAMAVTVGTGLLVAATGIGAKVNKAASKVFGEDLVSFANLAGGLAMAAGWDPAGMLGGATEAASGALATAAGQTADQMSTLNDLAGGGLVDAATSGAEAYIAPSLTQMVEPSAGSVFEGFNKATGAPNLDRLSISSNGASVAAGDLKTDGALATASKWWDKQTPQVKAALIQTAGSAVSGAAQGYAHAKDQERQDSRDRVYKSGSGVRFNYGSKAGKGG